MNPASPASSAKTQSRPLIPLTMALFFAFGFCTVLVDTLTPKLKGMFALSYADVMLTPFAFFGAYFLVSLPASWLLGRIGYLQSVVVGLLIAAWLAVCCSRQRLTPVSIRVFCWRCSSWLRA